MRSVCGGTTLTARSSAVASVALLALLAFLALRNAFTYPSIGGYDAQEYITGEIWTDWAIGVDQSPVAQPVGAAD